MTTFQPKSLAALLPWIVPVAILLTWEAISDFGYMPQRILPAPSAVLAAAWRLTLSGELGENVWVSFQRAMTGFAIGGTIGFALGLANGLSRLSYLTLDSTIQMIRNIPLLALIPLVILWFGIGETAKIFLVSLGVFFPIYINTLHGVRTVDPQLIEMGRVYGMSRWQIFSKVLFPGALPSIFVGLRYSLGFSWFLLVVAETLAATSGVGHMAMEAREFLLIDIVVLAILMYALLGKLADSIVASLERVFLAWHPAYATASGGSK